jgi:hypothetical protein
MPTTVSPCPPDGEWIVAEVPGKKCPRITAREWGGEKMFFVLRSSFFVLRSSLAGIGAMAE